MRSNAVGVLAALMLVSPALLTDAEAQRHGIGGGASAVPHISAPAPHFSAPAPHMPGPRFSAPHVTAPPPAAPHLHMSAPRFSAPQVRIPASHFAGPHNPAPHFSPRSATPHRFAAPARHNLPGTVAGRAGSHRPGALARHHVGPALSHVPSATGRLNTLSRSTARQERLHGNAFTGTASGAVGAANVAHDRRATPGSAETVGQGPGGANRNLAQTARAQMHGNRTPILRNPVFANVSTRNSETRSLAHSTFRGTLAQSAFARDWGRRRDHRRFGIVLGFVGPLFWPYAYEDFIDYTFWPYAYDTFWPYAFDDVFEGIYGAYAPEYYASEDAYAYAGSPASGAAYAHATGAPRRGRTAVLAADNAQICSGQAEGLADFPIERIAQQAGPDQPQQALLDDLKTATAKAVSVLQAACPSELPSTPTGRIAAMRARVAAMLQAVQVVRPALEKFYQSLNDEQKERFNALDQGNEMAGRQQPDLTGLCSGRTAQNAGLPVDQIERTLHLSDEQEARFKVLKDASADAADILKANCQPDQSLTPTGRLAAMGDRFSAMLQALDAVQPALAKFYESLNDEQKARFNRLHA